jgi:hypothetical protein
MAGEQTIGVLYNFVHDGLVLNYQSGFLYESDNRLKPGLVSLVLSVEDAIARGERGYDFMAGAAGHKNRLGNSRTSPELACCRQRYLGKPHRGWRRSRRANVWTLATAGLLPWS